MSLINGNAHLKFYGLILENRRGFSFFRATNSYGRDIGMSSVVYHTDNISILLIIARVNFKNAVPRLLCFVFNVTSSNEVRSGFCCATLVAFSIKSNQWYWLTNNDTVKCLKPCKKSIIK